MIMSSLIKERDIIARIIDIKATAEEYHEVAGDLLTVHGISGTDMVSAFHRGYRQDLSSQKAK